MKQVMLTTKDNPFNPFTQYEEWKAFDEDKGYFTNNYLARIVRTSNDLSEADQEAAINTAIDEIVELNILGIYRKAYQMESN
jgi:hypothetical protein